MGFKELYPKKKSKANHNRRNCFTMTSLIQRTIPKEKIESKSQQGKKRTHCNFYSKNYTQRKNRKQITTGQKAHTL